MKIGLLLNQMIKYYKFGFGTTDYVNEEIRLGRMNRKNGIEILEKYDGCCSEEYIQSFCDYLGISESFFWDKVHKSMNKKLFELKPNGEISKKFEIGIGMKNEKISVAILDYGVGNHNSVLKCLRKYRIQSKDL